MKLYYFDGAGRAEAIRMLLTHAMVPFEDIRLKYDESWPEQKKKFELGQVPALEVEGKMYCQTNAILEYLGLKYGYLPKDDYDKVYNIMFVINTLEDIYMKAMYAVGSWSPYDEKAKAEQLENVINVSGPMYLGAIEKVLKENSSKEFIVGKKHTIADFVLLGAYRNLQAYEPLTKAYYQKFVEKHPTLHAYLETRMKDFNNYYKLCKTKVYYFDAPGRAEMIRVTLKYLKIDFEDVRFKWDDWLKVKTSGKFELQRLPAAECEPCGAMMCETDAIMHRIGARFGLLPFKKPQKLYKVLWWCNTARDIIEGCCKVYLAIPEDKKKAIMQQFFEKSVPVFLQGMENKLKLNKSQCYLVGRKNTLADFYLIGVWRGFMNNEKYPEFKELLPKYPVLKEYIEKKDKLC